MENLFEKESVKRVIRILNEFNSELKVQVLSSSARTAIDAANSLKCEVGAIVKSLLLKADNGFVLCLVSGDKRCSLNKLKKVITKKDVCMANADEVKFNTGFSIGGVAPIAHLKKLNILIDKSLGRFQNVFAAAGHPNSIFKIKYNQLVQMTKGKEKEIVELFKAVSNVAKLLKVSNVDGGYRTLSNIGNNGGQEVPHLHFHVFGGEKVGKMVS